MRHHTQTHVAAAQKIKIEMPPVHGERVTLTPKKLLLLIGDTCFCFVLFLLNPLSSPKRRDTNCSFPQKSGLGFQKRAKRNKCC